MPIEVQWDNNEQTVIRWVYQWPWSWEEAYQAYEQEMALIDCVEHIVDGIADMRQAQGLPKGSLTAGISLMNKSHERMDLLVILGANRLIQSMYDMMRKLYPGMAKKVKLVIVRSEEEAYQVIAARRAERMQQIP